MDERDIWRTADVLLKTYGDAAELTAAKRGDAMLDLGDIDGQRVWRRVLAAVRELTTVTPGAKPN
jgi:hypothetical protein